MKKTLLIFPLLIGLLSCNTNQNENTETAQSENPSAEPSSIDKIIEKYELDDSKGYKLLVQKCYMCHFEVPDPARIDQLIAPPMLRIKEHYKPNHPNKKEFIDAIASIVTNPSKEKTLMPGAVKKFQLMPKLLYEDEELRLIAEAIYDHDFGSAPKVRMEMIGADGVQLNDGEKWSLKPESIKQMDAVIKQVHDFESDDIGDFNQLAKDVFNGAKQLMLDDSYTGEKFDQIHIFFYGIEDNMHLLMAIQSMDEANKQLAELKVKLNEFHDYFE